MKKDFLILLLSFACFQFASAADWINNRGNQPLTGVTSVILPQKVALKWTFKTGSEIKSSPVIKGNSIVIGSTDENVYCLDLNGKLRWKYKTDNAIEASALIFGNTVYIGNLSGNFYAINLLSGKLLWKLRADNQIMGGANWWTDGKKTYILFGSYDYFLRCVDASTGTIRWKYEAQNYLNATVAIEKNRAVFGGCDGFLHAVDIATGKKITSTEVATYVAGSVALENSRAYLGDYDGKVTCLDYIKKSVVWSFKNADKEIPFIASPSIVGNRLMIGSRDRFFYCFDKTNGKILWKKNTGNPVDASSVADARNVLVSNMRGDLMLLNQVNGAVVWTYELGSPIIGSPGISAHGIVVGAQDGTIYCLGIPSEKK
jgi:outer membrane protein assembly factor BamB